MPQRRLWRLRSLGGRFIVMRSRDLEPTEVPLSPQAGWKLMERVLNSPKDASDLATLAGAMSADGIGHPRQLNRSALERAIGNGTLVLLPVSAGLPNNPGGTSTAESVTDQILTARVVKTWVEIELVDTGGAPVAGQRYVCMMPDGDVREGQLDAKGRVRFDGIDPGNCVLTFPELDRDVWQPAQ